MTGHGTLDLDEREHSADVHGGWLWGTWRCACRAGGATLSRSSAAKQLRRHVHVQHGPRPVGDAPAAAAGRAPDAVVVPGPRSPCGQAPRPDPSHDAGTADA